MLYAALTFWLLIIMFSAWAVHALWSRLVKPRVVNSVLLPGTLVAQLGHVLGLLVTGHAVQNTQLMGDDDTGEPESDTPDKPRVPVVGPVVIALLPLAACGLCLYWAARYWGRNMVEQVATRTQLAQQLPLSLASFWDLLRDGVTMAQQMLDAIVHADLWNWPTALFLYLAICLTVRMAPTHGNRRGAIGAIFLAGLLIALISLAFGQTDNLVTNTWPVLSFAVAMLLLLLIFSLIVTGIVGLAQVLMRGGSQ